MKENLNTTARGAARLALTALHTGLHRLHL
jgi:hypothetical protein